MRFPHCTLLCTPQANLVRHVGRTSTALSCPYRMEIRKQLQRHGDSRFSDFDKTTETRTIDRAGWWSDETNHREYRLNRTGMHEALKGFDFKRALNVLVQHEVLPPPLASGEKARTYRINGQSLKLYPINTEKLFGDKDVTWSLAFIAFVRYKRN